MRVAWRSWQNATPTNDINYYNVQIPEISLKGWPEIFNIGKGGNRESFLVIIWVTIRNTVRFKILMETLSKEVMEVIS